MSVYARLLIILSVISSLCGDTLVVTLGVQPGYKLNYVAGAYIDEINRQSSDSLHVELIYQPWARASESLCNGEIDGDMARAHMVYVDCDSVVAVGVPVGSFYTFAFANPSYFDTAGSQPHEGTRYVTIYGNMTSKYWLDSNNLSYLTVNHFHQALEMIHLGRADCFIANDIHVKDTLFRHYGIAQGDTALQHRYHYLFLHISQKHHVPELESIITNMNETGFLEKILEQR